MSVISLELEIKDFLSEDGPGRAVFRQEVPPRSARWSHERFSRATAAVVLVNRPDEALDQVLGDDGHRD